MLTNTEKSRTNVYLNKEKKEQAKAIFKEYGMGLSDAINIFLTQSVASRGLPFEVRLPEEQYMPNEKTIQAIEDIDNPKTSNIMTLEEFKQAMENNFANYD